MIRTRLLAGLLAAAATGTAEATVLTFDLDTTANGLLVPQAYGDRVGPGFADPTGTYGADGGPTPEVVTSYDSPMPELWTTGYGSLANVLYEDEDGEDLVFSLAADPGFEVALAGFDIASCEGNLAGCPGSTAPFRLTVTGSTRGLLYDETVSASNIAATALAFTDVLDRALVVRLFVGALGSGSDGVGVDNISFSSIGSAVIPLPATALLLGTALFGLGALARRDRLTTARRHAP